VARFAIQELDREDDQHLVMRREVRAGLTASPRSLPSKYFYDDVGSRLFDEICELPEYYLTRAEYALLARHAGELVTGCESLLEIGSGMARKTHLLVAALCERAARPTYVPFDISRATIDAATSELLAKHPQLHVHGVIGDFTRDLHAIVRPPLPRAPRLFAFLGSTVGNLDETAAPAFVRSVSRLMSDADRFLLGVDLVKDERVLHAAYNDSAGVTAAFNKNILRVIARELGGDPVPDDAFEHLAFYAAERARIEMHLVATRPYTLWLRELDLRVQLAAGEDLMTEISRKFTRASVEQTLAAGGMRLEHWFADELFGLAIARRA
jgi:L-histidine Nalpha-methyltransferase